MVQICTSRNATREQLDEDSHPKSLSGSDCDSALHTSSPASLHHHHRDSDDPRVTRRSVQTHPITPPTHPISLVVHNIYHPFFFLFSFSKDDEINEGDIKGFLLLTREMDVFFCLPIICDRRVLSSHRWLPVRIPHGPRAEMCPAC